MFFQRGQLFYILGGTTCCACKGGSSIYVFMAPHPLGPWRYAGDIGRNRSHIFDIHSPFNFVTRAQGSAVFQVANQVVWMGNQWVTSGVRNSGLLYFTKLEFQTDGTIAQVVRRPNCTFET